MKSVWASGRPPHFCRLAPSPTPHQPPEAIAYMPALAWSLAPFSSAVGSRKAASRRIRTGRGDEQRDHAQRCRRGRGQPAPASALRRSTARRRRWRPSPPPSRRRPGRRPAGSARRTPAGTGTSRCLGWSSSLLLAGQQIRAPDDHGQLGELRRLDPERGQAEVEPVAVALHSRCPAGCRSRSTRRAASAMPNQLRTRSVGR